jgi:hypothetical protein
MPTGSGDHHGEPPPPMTGWSQMQAASYNEHDRKKPAAPD